MRAFEFHPGEVTSSGHKVTVIDLDAIVMFEEVLISLDHMADYTMWVVTLSNGSVNVTKSAFDRTLLAWKSK
jgi:hypothetical protein